MPENRSRSLIPLLALVTACQGTLEVEGGLADDTVGRAGAIVSLDGRLQIETGSDTLIVDRARINIGELEVEGRTEASEFEVEGRVLELGLAGAATPIAVEDVPAGTYEELGFEITRGGSGDAADFGGEDPASIIVDGSFNGASFSYRSDFAGELEFDLGRVDVRDGEATTVTVTFDVAGWFADASGNMIDPADPGHRELIEANIRGSVAAHVEEEDDEDDDENDDD